MVNDTRLDADSVMSSKKSLSSKTKAAWFILVLSAVALVFWTGLTSTNSNENENDQQQGQQQGHRRDIAYSKLSTIPPDPDAKVACEEQLKELGAKYGHWHFWDGEEDNRPDNADLCGKFGPLCDVPGDEFPDDSWQGDAVFVNHILNDADKLVSRAMEAIFEEYGHPKPKTAEGLAERMKMFHWDKIDLKTAQGPPEQFDKSMARANGGWTTKRSFEGLVRRILHAIMTSGTFTVVLAGHSSAAGHGNHFRQSYSMQFQKIMAPIFARLGVKLITRNISQGGLGTLQGTLGSGDIYGNKVDLLIWDSGMTEKTSRNHIDLFFRQGLMAGDHVPVIWSAGGTFDILKTLHEEAGADVGEFGLGLAGMEPTTSDEHAQTLPWAVRYFKCDNAANDVCKRHNGYCTKCWIPRDDGIQPEAKQQDHVGGQVSWHPGWRQHQLTGRVLAFSVLEAMQLAVQQFSDGTMGGPPLADDYWHVGKYFKNIQDKVKNMDPSLGECYKIAGDLPGRLCKTPMKGRTHYTPRANYDETGITSIVKPAADGYIPKNSKKPLYEGPDAHNDCFDIPPGEVDVLSIVSGRRRRTEEVHFNVSVAPAGDATKKMTTKTESTPSLRAEQQRRELDEIKPGKGWQLYGEPQGQCDGTYYAVCDRSTDSPCVLAGHHDARGSLVGNALSGWLVMNVKVKEGIIILKVHSWAKSEQNTITKDWTTENNERRALHELDDLGKYDYDVSRQRQERSLGGGDPADAYPESFVFEYAINGVVTSLNKEKYKETRKQAQRVVEVLTLMDDPNFTQEPVDVEVAVRLQGCGKDCTIAVSHIYWA